MVLAGFSGPEPVNGPARYVHRNYVPRVFKSYIKAFYKMIKITAKILIIIMIIKVINYNNDDKPPVYV